MSLKHWLAASIAANFVLTGLFVVQSWQGDAIGGRPPSDVSATSVKAGETAPAIVVSSGDDASRDKLMALAALELAAREAVPPPKAQFWIAARDSMLAEHERGLNAQRAQIREQLVSRFGPEAADDPAFARIFRPLDSRYPYLSSKSQLALLELRQKRLPPVAGGSRSGPPDPAQDYRRQVDFERQLQAVFMADEFELYRLNESMPAQQLRASGLEFTEAEFREAIGVMQKLDEERTAASYLAGQGKLKSVLGDSRYVRFSASRDPAFASLQPIGARHQLTTDQMYSVYGLLFDAQRQLAGIGLERKAGAVASSAASPQEIIEARDAGVAQLVGETAARELLESYSSGMVSASLRVMNNGR